MDPSNPMNDIAQAFSHFTYAASKKKMLIIDIQGVGLKLTDPSILSTNQEEFGITNSGKLGINSFFDNHVCNHICSKLITSDDKLQDSPLLLGSKMFLKRPKKC